MRGKKKLPFYEKLEILDAVSEGKCIAKIEDLVIFISNVVPGDIVDVQINYKKKNYQEGYAVHTHKYSEKRIPAFCSHFGVCGGCKWQNMPYILQLEFKQKEVKDLLKKFGKIELPEINAIIPSAKTQYYRNKLEYSFSARRWMLKEECNDETENKNLCAIGFHVASKFDKIVDIDHCYLQREPSNIIRNDLKKFAIENQLSFYDIKRNEGFMRSLIVRTSSRGENMVILVFAQNDLPNIQKCLNYLSQKFPEINSLFYVVNSKLNDQITDLELILYKGNPYIWEEMEGLKFKISPKSFYQPNSEQAYELYKIVRKFADLQGNETVYDLYTGTGTIANFIAKSAKSVIGVEIIEDAILDAKMNSEINGIQNTKFFVGDMADVLRLEFFAVNGTPDIIILDPPRVGVHQKALRTILDAAPKRIVYVSCNPATQARDLAILDEKYRVIEIQPVDMFPHTHHVENVVRLDLKFS